MKNFLIFLQRLLVHLIQTVFQKFILVHNKLCVVSTFSILIIIQKFFQLVDFDIIVLNIKDLFLNYGLIVLNKCFFLVKHIGQKFNLLFFNNHFLLCFIQVLICVSHCALLTVFLTASLLLFFQHDQVLLLKSIILFFQFQNILL